MAIIYGYHFTYLNRKRENLIITHLLNADLNIAFATVTIEIALAGDE